VDGLLLLEANQSPEPGPGIDHPPLLLHVDGLLLLEAHQSPEPGPGIDHPPLLLSMWMVCCF
jgi:hypothetical protein